MKAKSDAIFFGGQDGQERWEKGNGISLVHIHSSLAFEFAAARSKIFLLLRWWLFGEYNIIRRVRG